MLDIQCEPVGWGPLVVLMARRSILSVLALLSQYSELDCEENKLVSKAVLVSYTKIDGKI